MPANTTHLVDTHVHLDAHEFDADRPAVIKRAQQAGVAQLVIPAVHSANFTAVRELAHQIPGAVYTLGIHPLYVSNAKPEDLQTLAQALHEHRQDPKLAGVGEIGLDGFVAGADMALQTHYFHAQLKLAKQFDLPVIMHVRKAQDLILKGLRTFKPKAGIAHAFNGSLQQAEAFIGLNCCLGFGGTLTFERSLQIRRLLCNINPNFWVLETDAPDIAPHWIYKQRNEPAELRRIAQVAASLLQTTEDAVAQLSTSNAIRVLPALTEGT
jgi:TatD DNase family protein